MSRGVGPDRVDVHKGLVVASRSQHSIASWRVVRSDRSSGNVDGVFVGCKDGLTGTIGEAGEVVFLVHGRVFRSIVGRYDSLRRHEVHGIEEGEEGEDSWSGDCMYSCVLRSIRSCIERAGRRRREMTEFHGRNPPKEIEDVLKSRKKEQPKCHILHQKTGQTLYCLKCWHEGRLCHYRRIGRPQVWAWVPLRLV